MLRIVFNHLSDFRHFGNTADLLFHYYGRSDSGKPSPPLGHPAVTLDFIKEKLAHLGIPVVETDFNLGRSPRLIALARYDLDFYRKRMEGLFPQVVVDVETWEFAMRKDKQVLSTQMECYLARKNRV